VSGGVEASAGMKDERRVGDFVARAKAAAEALK
jgi:phosphoribosylanthranilate isomerase